MDFPNVTNWHDNISSAKERDAYLFKNVFMSDCAFVIEEGVNKRKFPCHKYILGASSWEFYNYFYLMVVDSNEIPISDVSAMGLTMFLEFLYKETTELDMIRIWDVVNLAVRFAVNNLKKFCEDFLLKQVNSRNVFFMFERSSEYNMETLMKACVKLMYLNDFEFSESPALLHLSKVSLTKLIKSDDLLLKEIVIFRAVNRWAENYCRQNNKIVNSENKRFVLADSFKFIRFGLMTNAEFVECTGNHPFLSDREIRDIFVDIGSNNILPSAFSSISRNGTRKSLLYKPQNTFKHRLHKNIHMGFKVSKYVKFLGFGLYEQQICLNGAKCPRFELVSEGLQLYNSSDIEILYDRTTKMYEFLIKDGLFIEANKPYFLKVEWVVGEFKTPSKYNSNVNTAQANNTDVVAISFDSEGQSYFFSSLIFE